MENRKKITDIWQKKFKEISKNAIKNNITLMLNRKKVVVYPYWIEKNEVGWNYFHSASDGVEPLLIERPAQYWYQKMIDEFSYNNFIFPCKTSIEARKILKKLKQL